MTRLSLALLGGAGAGTARVIVPAWRLVKVQLLLSIREHTQVTERSLLAEPGWIGNRDGDGSRSGLVDAKL